MAANMPRRQNRPFLYPPDKTPEFDEGKRSDLIAGYPPTRGDTKTRVHDIWVRKIRVPPPSLYRFGVGVPLFCGPKFRERGFWISPPVGGYPAIKSHLTCDMGCFVGPFFLLHSFCMSPPFLD